MPRNTSSIGTSRRAGAPTSPSSAATRRSPTPTCSNASTGSGRRCATGWRSGPRNGSCCCSSTVRRSRSVSSGRSRSARFRFHSTRCGRPPTTVMRSPTRRARMVVVSRELLPELEKIPRSDLPALRHRRGRRSGRRVRRAAPARIAVARRAGREPRCTRVLAVLVGEHGSPERVRAPAARHGRLRRALREGRARSHRGRSLLQRPQAVLRLRARERGLLPARRRRDEHPLARAAAAGARLRDDRAIPADLVLLGADRLRNAAGARRGVRSLVDPSGGIGGRSAAARHLRSLPAAIRRSRSSTASGRPRRSTCSSRTGLVESRPGTSGVVVDGYDARILDDAGVPVAAGEIGNLWISGDSTCACYWNQHEKSKATFQGEWLRTGDKYSQDADGFFCYAGRSDDMLKVGGLWVSPVEVENALIEHPAVQECGVVGRDDRDGLTKPAAFVVLQVRTAGQRRSSRRSCSVRSRAARGIQAATLGRVPAGAAEDRHWQDSAIPAECGQEGPRSRLIRQRRFAVEHERQHPRRDAGAWLQRVTASAASCRLTAGRCWRSGHRPGAGSDWRQRRDRPST